MSARFGGFSLVELMVSSALGLLAVAAVGNLFQWTASSHRHDERHSGMTDALRFAMAQITADVEMAGFFGPSGPGWVNVDAGARAAYQSNCPAQWVFDDREAIDTLGNADAARVRDLFPCTNGARTGSDVLVLKRVAAECTPAPRSNRFYLRTTGTLARIQYGGAGLAGHEPCAPVPGEDSVAFYQYLPVIWYVADDRGTPSLCRERLSGSTMVRECVAEGIEDLQLEFGIDETGAGGHPDGLADYFQSFDGSPTLAQRRAIVSVRIALLARSVREQRGYRNDKAYVLGNVTHAPAKDAYLRSVLTSVVRVRNHANRRRPQALD